ncbi:hypothetical protein NCS55_00667500 [Fusarium keratoplasticum]|nr:hypothetical protein NCS55_00667500 [Fusarium keratoplasticum]
MPPFAAELEEWWLGSGYEALTRLTNNEDDQLSPRQCGFARDLQRRLLSFDNDRALQAEIQEAWPAIRTARGINYSTNLRDKVKDIVRNVFRQPEDGGIDSARAMNALGYLDAMEIDRLRRVETAKAAVEAQRTRVIEAKKSGLEVPPVNDTHPHILEELDRTTSVKYKRFHAGFRSWILIKELTQDADLRKEIPQIMALLNALFPSAVFLEDQDDRDPTPYSPGLRDSIRFAVFEHLMSQDPFSQQRQQVLQMKLLCWCDIPQYPQAREALIRYHEETKKLGEICSSILNAAGEIIPRQRPPSDVPTEATSAESSSLKSRASTAHSSWQILSSSPRTQSFEETFSASSSFDARRSGLASPLASPVPSSAPPVPNPLLKGMPGREFSPAKTDGARFAGDLHAPPILCYPDDISKTEFLQHPLAREFDMTSLENLDSEDDEDDENESDHKKNPPPTSKTPAKKGKRSKTKEPASPAPPIPPIPGSVLSTNATPKVLQKFLKHMISRSELKQGMVIDPASLQAIAEHASVPLPSGSTSTKSRRVFKTKILRLNTSSGVDALGSNSGHDLEVIRPLLKTVSTTQSCFDGDSVLEVEPLTEAIEDASEDQLLPDIVSPTVQTQQDDADVRYQLGKPRLSPMEYTRLYLIEKANSERENRPCELPRPGKRCYWSVRGETFLVIPQIPDCIRRDLAPGDDTNREGSGGGTEPGSDTESVATVRPAPPSVNFPRLSLHLGDMRGLLLDIPFANIGNETNLSETNALQEASLEANVDVQEGLDPTSLQQHVVTDLETDRLSCYETKLEDGSKFLLSMTPDQAPESSISDDNDDMMTGETPPEQFLVDPTDFNVGSSRKLQDQSESSFQTPKICVETSHLAEQPAEQLRRLQKGFQDCPLSPETSRLHAGGLLTSDYATPKAKGKAVEYSAYAITSTVTQSPLARFPIAVQPGQRLTPGTLTRRVIGAAGGQICVEDSHQAQLVHSLDDELPQGLSADLWDDDAESMISALQPEPLKINRPKLQNKEEGDRRWSGLFDALTGDVSPEIGILGVGDLHERERESDEMAEESRMMAEKDQTVRRLQRQLRSHLDPNLSPERSLQRSSSTLITPTQPRRNVDRKASFNIEPQVGHSGFTPEHNEEEPTGGTFPRSRMMLNLRDTQARLRYPLRELNEAQLSRSHDNAPLAIRRLPDVPNRHQQRAALRDLERAVTATPRRALKFPRESIDGPEGSNDVSRWSDSTESSGWTQVTAKKDDDEPYPSTTTQDFSQSTKLKKQRPNQKSVPVDTPRPSTRQGDASVRASSSVSVDKEAATVICETPTPDEPSSTPMPRTPSSAISSLFRKRVRSEHGNPATPRTPVTPRTHWRPFDDPDPQLPCSSPWLSGQREDKREKEARAAYFREKAERDLEGKPSLKKSSRKGSFGSIRSRGEIKRKSLGLDRRQSMESLVGWKSFIEDAPEPLFSSPLPPVPPLPTPSQLNLTLNRLDQAQAQAPLRAASAVEASLAAAAYRSKKPQGLKVETRKLRKASRDELRGTWAPSSTTTATAASGSSGGGLRTALRLDGRKSSSGRATVDEGERLVDRREDEVVSRRR